MTNTLGLEQAGTTSLSIVTGCKASAKVGGAMFEDKLAREREATSSSRHCRDFALEKWSRV